MIRVDFERSIDAPIEEVFDRLADIDAYRTWLPRSLIYVDSRTVDETDGVDVGTVFHDRSTLGRLTGEVTAFDRPTHIAFRQTLSRRDAVVFESRPEYRLESAGEVTRVRHRGEAEPRGPLRFTLPVVWLVAQYERRRVVRALKRAAEHT